MAADNHLINYEGAVKNLTSTLISHVTTLKDVTKEYKNLNKEINVPSEHVKQLKEIIKVNKELSDAKSKLAKVEIDLEKARKATADADIKEIDLLIKKLKLENEELRVKMQEINLTNKQTKQVNDLVKSREREIQALEKSNNVYNRIQQKVNSTTQSYNNLAAKRELGISLTGREERMLALYESRLIRYGTILKDIDSKIGNYRRNVGNYASGWNGLSNSINQITREMPAFAVSLNTGFLALSNNLPILFDEIQRTKNQIAQLRAEGKPTQSLLSTLASSFFSLQTAMSIGVTLLTLYGGKLIEIISNSIKASRGIDILKESQKQYNEALIEGSKNAQQEIQELKVLIGVAQSASASTKTRLDAVKKLQEMYPNYFENLSKEQIMNSDLTKITKELTGALMSRAIAVASINKMTENASKILDLEEQNRLEKERLVTLEKRAKTQAEITKQTLTTTTRENDVYTTGRLQDATSKVLTSKRNIAQTQDQINKLTEINNRLEQKAIEQQIKGGSIEKTKKTKDKTDNTLRDRLKAEKEYQLSLLETQKEQAKANDELDLYYTLSMQLADKKREYNLKIAALEIKDAQTLNNKKLEIEQEYITEIIKVNEEEVKEVDKKQNEILKVFEKFYQLRVTQSKKAGEKLRKELENQYDILQLENELNSIGLDQNTIKYYENQRKQLEDWYSYQTEVFKGQTEKLLLIQKEYEAKKKQIAEDEKQLFKDFIAQFSSLENFGFGSLDMLFNGQFELIMKGAETLEEKFAAVFGAIGNFAKDAFAFMQQNSDAYYQHEFDSLAKQKEIALKYAGENAEGRQMIEDQYEERMREIKRKQAKEAKAMAIFNATMNIAQGITAALAQGIQGIPLSIIIGALGAVQIAMIASQPIPGFWTGTNNAPEGLALTQEKGAEVITDRKGNIKTFGHNNGPTLTYLNQGDIVYKSQEDFIRKMSRSYITPDGSLVIHNNSLTKDDMIDVMEKAMKKQSKPNIKFDENGMKVWITNGHNTTFLSNKKIKI